MRLTVVGCSGSFPGPESAASCYLLEADGFRLVIDMGNGSLGRAAAVRTAVRRGRHRAQPPARRPLRRPVLLLGRADLRPGRAAAADPGLRAGRTRERIGLLHSPEGDDGLPKRFTFETLAPGSMRIGPFDVTLAHMNHPVETFGFRFAHDGRTLAYTGDTGETDAVIGAGQRRRRVPIRGGVPRRARPAARPAPDRPPGGRLRVPGRRGTPGPHPPAALERPDDAPARRRRRPSTAPSTWPSPDRSSTWPGSPCGCLGRARARPR